MRVHVPRTLPAAMIEFEAAARQGMLEASCQHGWTVIDVAANLNGRDEYFADLVHFNDKGAGTVAELIAREIVDK